MREKAQEKVFSDLGRVRALKAERPNLIIGVGGCVASQEGNAQRLVKLHVEIVRRTGNNGQHRDSQLVARQINEILLRKLWPVEIQDRDARFVGIQKTNGGCARLGAHEVQALQLEGFE